MSYVVVAALAREVPEVGVRVSPGGVSMSIDFGPDVTVYVALQSPEQVDAWATALATAWSSLSKAGLDAFGPAEVAS